MNLYFLQEAQQGGGMQQIIMIVAMIGIFYFFMIRPQMKRNKEQRNFRDALKAGDKVVTTGGIHGEIDQINETEVILKVESGAKMRVEKAALTSSFNPVQK